MSDENQLTEKAALRIHMRALRRRLAAEHPDADWRAGEHVTGLLQALNFDKPSVAAIYRAAGAEMDPRPLADNLEKRGWLIALPSCEDLDCAVVFRTHIRGERLFPDLMNILAPGPSSPKTRPDIIIAPVLAFDGYGGRLGQGGGYYDRTIEALRAQPDPPAFVGLAFAGQEIDKIPLERHDQRLDAILTENGYRPFP
jgi:5-formyltetrahydrofolate cyclo-ligase